MSIETPGGEPTPSPPEAATIPPKRRPSLWRHSDFVKLWTAQTITQFGDEITQFALPLVAILELRAGPFELGLLGPFQFLPFILLTIPAGVWVDRLRRKPILISADIGRALLLSSIPVAFIGGWLSIWQLYVVAFGVGCLEVFFDIAYQSYLPSVVDREQLVEGNAKLEISTSASTFVGPSVAGFLVELFRAPIAIVFDAISYAGSVMFLMLIRRPETPPEPHDPATGKRPSMIQEARAGWSYVFRNRYLRAIAPCTALFNLFGNIFFVVFILYAIQELGLTPITLGIVFAVSNLGVLVGALTSERIAKRIGIGPAIVGGAILSPLGPLLVVFASPETAIPLLVASGLIGTFSTVVYNVNQVSLRQAITPERMQGRMNATMRFLVWGTIPIGALSGGVLGTTIGLQNTILVGALGTILAIFPVLFSPVRTLERIPDPEPT